MKFENLNLRLDSILEREIDLGRTKIRLVGSNSLVYLGFLLTQSQSSKVHSAPHLIVVPQHGDALKFQQILQFFAHGAEAHLLGEFDVSPYDGLEPSPSIQTERLRFLFHAHQLDAKSARQHTPMFVGSAAGFLQKTLPFKIFKEHCYLFVKGSELPEGLPQFLNGLGYTSSPQVESVGQYALRGGIVDIFSPAHEQPIRMELFGDQIESLRFFSPLDQHSSGPTERFFLIPAKETIWLDDNLERAAAEFRKNALEFKLPAGAEHDLDETLRSLTRKIQFPGQDFCLPFFYQNPETVLSHFSSDLVIWLIEPTELSRISDQLLLERKNERQASTSSVIRPPVEGLYTSWEQLQTEWSGQTQISLSAIDTLGFEERAAEEAHVQIPTFSTQEFAASLGGLTVGSETWLQTAKQKMQTWVSAGYKLILSVRNRNQAERLKVLFERMSWTVLVAEQDQYLWETWWEQLSGESVLIVPRTIPDSIRIPEERVIFLRERDFLGATSLHDKKGARSSTTASQDFQKKASLLSFGELKPGDFIVHSLHGIGIYEGLKVMSIGGADSEFIQLAYKDKDKLYLPVYRVGQLQKYSGAHAALVLDKLGGTGWEKTKSKVKNQVRDLANELLLLYAKRSQLQRPPFQFFDNDMSSFEASFPFEETEDQHRAIEDLKSDLKSDKPMDRLICGDVGFGKTEVAMRAAFVAAHAKKQVAILAPTTILSFQHYQTFKKRFHGLPYEIRELNRFVSGADAKATIKDLAEGKVDILIGTHRLLSKDIVFKDLGLLVVDEEQKFGVAHKERIRKLKTSVDTLAMSATPIPRTLNMSLVGVRDLSLINTPPVDRLPTRTFVCRWDDETIRKAIENEISRGGQIYFIHNRVQSIHGVADELRKLVPNARLGIGHGQMEEHQLEKVMVTFFNHEIDILLCTTIVESGMDVSRANTMIIDQAHMMGLSQLYQLRGRVGRSKERAYCYLLMPKDRQIDKLAQERLKVIQDNSALGSGIRIAQYDLELRGSGNILGEDQSGHINAVGYEMYLDLLNECVAELRGDPATEVEVDPEINLRVPALIPESYIKDIRLRLSYYKALAEIRSTEDLDKIEEDLRDQFGAIPEATINLMGLMLIRHECRVLGIKDVTAGPKNLSLTFSPATKMRPEVMVKLATQENKKYSITPDHRLNVRLNNVTWPAVYEEIQLLKKWL